jgi:hypothetical protein
MKMAKIASSSWWYGAVWVSDGTALLVHAAIVRAIEVYGFDGSWLARDQAATTRLAARHRAYHHRFCALRQDRVELPDPARNTARTGAASV